jgi:hypothetical protein
MSEADRNAAEASAEIERETLRTAVGAVLFNAMNFPENVQARLLGQDMTPLNKKITDAILSRGFRLHPAPHITDEAVEAVARAIFGYEQCARQEKATPELLEAQWNSRLDEGDQADYREEAHAILEAASAVSARTKGENE